MAQETSPPFYQCVVKGFGQHSGSFPEKTPVPPSGTGLEVGAATDRGRHTMLV